jgi:hypothetical protein
VDPRRAQIDRRACELDRVHASTDPIAGFEHDDLDVYASQHASEHEPREPSPDDDCAVGRARHRRDAVETSAGEGKRGREGEQAQDFTTDQPTSATPSPLASATTQPQEHRVAHAVEAAAERTTSRRV